MNGIKTAGGGEISCPFGAPRMTVRGVIFHYTTSQHFCQAKVDRQIAQNFSQNLVQDYYLIFLLKYIIIIIQGKERKKSQRKKIKKKCLTFNQPCVIIKEKKGKEIDNSAQRGKKKNKKS